MFMKIKMLRRDVVHGAFAVLFLGAFTAAAQSPAQNWKNVTALTAGTEVRITAGSLTVRGQVRNVTGDTLVVDSGKGQEMFTRQEVTRVSVRKKGHRGRNTLIGLGLGAGGGLGLGLANRSGSSSPTFFTYAKVPP